MIQQPVKKIVFVKIAHTISRHYVIEVDTYQYLAIISKALYRILFVKMNESKAMQFMNSDLLIAGRVIATVRIKTPSPNKNEPQPITSNELQLHHIASSLSGKSVREGVAKKENSFRYGNTWWKGLLTAISRTLGFATKHSKRQNE
jgi:hypothetical protein